MCHDRRWRPKLCPAPLFGGSGGGQEIVGLVARALGVGKTACSHEVRNDRELLQQFIIEFASALIGGKCFVPISRLLIGVPANQHGARLLLAVEPEEQIGKAKDGAGRPRPSCGYFSAARDRRGAQTSRHRSPAAAGDLPTLVMASAFALCVRRFGRDLGGRAGSASSWRNIAQLYPDWRMIAGVFFAAHCAIDTRCNKPFRGFFAQKQMVDTKPGIARPPVTQVAPIGVHWIVRMKTANSIGPALA